MKGYLSFSQTTNIYFPTLLSLIMTYSNWNSKKFPGTTDLHQVKLYGWVKTQVVARYL